MEFIFSIKDPEILLHAIIRKSDINKPRQDISTPEMFMQVATLNLNKDATFKPHKHIWKQSPPTHIAQESWIVISGSVRCTFFDLNDKIIAEPILMPGDASITWFGGHTYTILEDNTQVVEYKTGPYRGIELDKVHIEKK